jgi:hypothetical protein
MAYAAYLRVYEPVSALRHLPSGSGDAAIDGVARDECELAVAIYLRARDRWRGFAEFERAN